MTRERLLTTRQVGDWLGFHAETLNEWRRQGKGPPAILVGSRWRYDPDAVAAWLAEQTVGRANGGREESHPPRPASARSQAYGGPLRSVLSPAPEDEED